MNYEIEVDRLTAELAKFRGAFITDQAAIASLRNDLAEANARAVEWERLHGEARAELAAVAERQQERDLLALGGDPSDETRRIRAAGLVASAGTASVPACRICKAKLGAHHRAFCNAGWGQVLPSEIPGFIESVADLTAVLDNNVRMRAALDSPCPAVHVGEPSLVELEWDAERLRALARRAAKQLRHTHEKKGGPCVACEASRATKGKR